MKERYLLEDGGDNNFSLITDYDGNDEQAFDVNVKSGEILPVLPLRNMVLFPGVFLPITVGRKSSLKLVRDADKKHKDIAVVCQRSAQDRTTFFLINGTGNNIDRATYRRRDRKSVV